MPQLCPVAPVVSLQQCHHDAYVHVDASMWWDYVREMDSNRDLHVSGAEESPASSRVLLYPEEVGLEGKYVTLISQNCSRVLETA